MHHFPLQIVAAGRPVVMIDSLVAVDGNEVLLGIGSQFAVEVGSRHNGFLILGKTAGRLLDDGEYLVNHFIEGLLIDFKGFFLQFVNMVED